MPTHEQLLHAFYAGNASALDELSARLDPILARIALLILQARGIALAALGEWDVDDRLADVWSAVVLSSKGHGSSWPHQHASALRWLIGLLCREMDRDMHLQGPF